MFAAISYQYRDAVLLPADHSALKFSIDGSSIASNTMPYTLLQTLNYLSATNRLNYSRRLSTTTHSTALHGTKRVKRSACRLVVCRGKTHKGKKLLVFKMTGPGKTVASFKNLPCGEAGCWVCGRFIGEFTINLSSCQMWEVWRMCLLMGSRAFCQGAGRWVSGIGWW